MICLLIPLITLVKRAASFMTFKIRLKACCNVLNDQHSQFILLTNINYCVLLSVEIGSGLYW